MRTHLHPSHTISEMMLLTGGPCASADVHDAGSGHSSYSASASPARPVPAALRRLAGVAHRALAGRPCTYWRFAQCLEASVARGRMANGRNEVFPLPPAALVNMGHTFVNTAYSVNRPVGTANSYEEHLMVTQVLRLRQRPLASSARRSRIPALCESRTLLRDVAAIGEPGRLRGPIRNILPHCRRLCLPNAPFE